MDLYYVSGWICVHIRPFCVESSEEAIAAAHPPTLHPHDRPHTLTFLCPPLLPLHIWELQDGTGCEQQKRLAHKNQPDGHQCRSDNTPVCFRNYPSTTLTKEGILSLQGGPAYRPAARSSRADNRNHTAKVAQPLALLGP